MSGKSKCVKCDRTDTAVWTLSVGGVAAIVDLCSEHEAPLRAVLGLSVGQKPEGTRAARPSSPRVVRKPKQLQPLNWTPPS